MAKKGLKRKKQQSGTASKRVKSGKDMKKNKEAVMKPEKKGRLIFRCSPPCLHKLVKELSSAVSKEQLNAVMKTPFRHFWTMPNISVSSRFVIAALKQWDSNSASINIGGRALPMTVDDLSVILGLKAYGKDVRLRKMRTKSQTLKTLFNSTASKADRATLIETLWILAGSTDETSVNNFVRAFVLMVFNTVLFPTKTYRIPPKLFVFVDNLEELDCYNWGKAVHEFLVVSIRRFLEDRGLEKLIKHNKATYIDGCIVGVLVSD
jgi:hypothetical protein